MTSHCFQLWNKTLHNGFGKTASPSCQHVLTTFSLYDRFINIFPPKLLPSLKPSWLWMAQNSAAGEYLSAVCLNGFPSSEPAKWRKPPQFFHCSFSLSPCPPYKPSSSSGLRVKSLEWFQVSERQLFRFAHSPKGHKVARINRSQNR